MLGGFVSLTVIQALTGILLTVIPLSSSESLCPSVVKPSSIPLDVFHIHLQFEDTLRDRLRVDILLYGMVFTLSKSMSATC